LRDLGRFINVFLLFFHRVCVTNLARGVKARERKLGEKIYSMVLKGVVYVSFRTWVFVGLLLLYL